MNQAVNKEEVNIIRVEKEWMVLATRHKNYTRHSGDIPWMKLFSLSREGNNITYNNATQIRKRNVLVL